MKKALTAIVAAVALLGCEQKTQAEKDAEACKDVSDAYYMTKQFVTGRLKSPQTAEFPSRFDIKVLDMGNCQHIVYGYVDSQNGFGALVRTRYTATVKSVGNGKWILENIDFLK